VETANRLATFSGISLDYWRFAGSWMCQCVGMECPGFSTEIRILAGESLFWDSPGESCEM
jgi:hypothetical protein